MTGCIIIPYFVPIRSSLTAEVRIEMRSSLLACHDAILGMAHILQAPLTDCNTNSAAHRSSRTLVKKSKWFIKFEALKGEFTDLEETLPRPRDIV